VSPFADRIKAMGGHLFDRLCAAGDGGSPLQKTIVFCASDHHADLVTNELNNRYSEWLKTSGAKRAPKFAFKCTASVDGQKLIADFRGRDSSWFIACTKDLLSTGVDVPCVRNVVFFRYVQSPRQQGAAAAHAAIAAVAPHFPLTLTVDGPAFRALRESFS
jgi:type I restriction enzyme R subunit